VVDVAHRRERAVSSGGIALSPVGVAVAAMTVPMLVLVPWAARPAPRRVRCVLAQRGARAADRHGRAPLRAVLLVGTGALAAVLWPPCLLAVGAWMVLAPWWRRRQARRRRDEAVVRGLPDTVDLLALAIGAGHTPRQGVSALARAAPWPFDAAFAEVDGRTARGERLVDALGSLQQLGAAVQPLSLALLGVERHGTALGSTLEQLRVEARRQRRLQAETAARKLPVRLSFPLVCCVLPAFVLLTLAPLLAGALSSLRL
jgi:tight adherence protein C